MPSGQMSACAHSTGAGLFEVLKDVGELRLHRIPGHWNPCAPIVRLDSPEDVLDRVEVGGVRGQVLELDPILTEEFRNTP